MDEHFISILQKLAACRYRPLTQAREKPLALEPDYQWDRDRLKEIR